ncbi:MAG: hypothetical protein IKV61_06680 [Clostridia bacterium]|nr:hypothetical protein [Clostridia bacterium]
MKNIYMIGNTHYDPVWTWTWDEGLTSIHSTFRSALDRMNESPDFIYSFSNPQIFEWIKKIDPQMFSEISKRIEEGRWDLNEGWWVQPDTFSASGESYARQSLYGQKYLKQNFNKYSKCLFNIDSFGHNSQTPQILEKSRMKYYCFYRPEKWFFELKNPYFTWKGKDGTKVRAFRFGHYGDFFARDVGANIERAEAKMQDAVSDEMIIYGVSNHGGAPTKQAIEEIKMMSEKKPYTVKCSSVEGYFEAQDEAPITHEGEMLTKNFGPYVNDRKTKTLNRVGEYSVLNAEKLNLITKQVLGHEYDAEKFENCWKDLLFNTFHDILGGASSVDVYRDAYRQYKRAIANSEESLRLNLISLVKNIKTVGVNPDPWNIFVFNFNETDYDGYVEAEMQWQHEFPKYQKGVALQDEDGNLYECGVILECSSIPGFRSRVVFKAKIPAVGYKVFKVVKTEKELPKLTNFNVVKTKGLTCEFDAKTGLIKNLYSAVTNKNYTNIFTPKCFKDMADSECFNFTEYGEMLEDFTLNEFKVVEDNEIRKVIKVTYKFRTSFLTVYYRFYNEADHLEIDYSINWHEEHVVLKFMTNAGYSTVSASSPFAYENRVDSVTDMPMGEWICLHNNTEGIGYIANSIFGYNKTGCDLGLTILRAPIYADMRDDSENDGRDYPIMEQGVTSGKLSIIPYVGNFIENEIPKKARELNNPPFTVCEPNHNGKLPSTYGFISVKGAGVQIAAVKKCEFNNDVIVRLNSLSTNEEAVNLKVFDNEFNFTIKPFEIKTVKIANGKLEEVLITEDN